ncbi:MAG: PAS domain-containing protein [Actinobacteria bacterium]|nr:PAS domain-containing protein [Actinomycetota bacterium]
MTDSLFSGTSRSAAPTHADGDAEHLPTASKRKESPGGWAAPVAAFEPDQFGSAANQTATNTEPARPGTRTYDETIQSYARIATTCAAIGAIIAAAVLIVWAAGIDSLVNVHTQLWIMHANTALAILLSAIAVLLIGNQDNRRREPGFFRPRTRLDLLIGTLGAAAATIGVLTIFEYAAGIKLGIDHALASVGPLGDENLIRGPSTVSTLMMTAIGAAIALSAWYGERIWAWVQMIAASTLLMSLMVLIADVYDTESIRNLSSPLGATVTSAVGFGLISIAVLLVRPLYGWMNLIAGEGNGSEATRRILPVVLFGIPVLGYVRLAAQNSGLIGTEVGLTLFAGATIVMTTVVVLWSAARINRHEDLQLISEAERDRARALVDGLVANSDAVISVQDPEGRFALINDAFERRYGVDREHAIGNRSYDVLDPERAFLLERLRNDVLARRNAAVEEMPADEAIDGKDEETYLTQLFPIVDDEGNLIGSGSIATDISERKRHEQLLQRLNDDLRHETDRAHDAIDELESFAHTVSHDLRSPLRAIDGFARIVAEDCQDVLEDRDRRYLDLVLQGAAEMGSLIDDLLEFSRVGRTELNVARLDMTKIAKEVNDHLSHERQGRDVRVTVKELPPAVADQRFIAAVFQNLLANAYKYSRKREVAEIEIGALEPDDGAPVTYYVRDNGVGFDMQYADKLFAPFERLHRTEDYDGSGVGLATVQRILRRHGGKIWAESKVDVGTTMFFRLD